MADLNEVLDVALAVAKVGGQQLLKHFEKTTITQKSQTYNLVTEADLESEKAIVQFIRDHFPDHQILGEEGSESSPLEAPEQFENLWIIDPLDGTNNFVHGIPHFAVSIAYARFGVPKVAVVFNPVTGELFQATSESQSMSNGTIIEVNESGTLGDCIVGVGFYYDRNATMKPTLNAIEAMFAHGIHGIRRMGTASLDLCYVACGRFGAYFEYELAPWDFAAGWLIVERAGGRATQCDGRPLTLANQSMLATNNLLHEVALQVTLGNYPASKYAGENPTNSR